MAFSSDPALLANQLPISIEFSKDDPERFQETLNLTYKRIASSVNSKEGALYWPVETATFQQYFRSGNPQLFRPVYRKVVDFGALPNAALKSVAHGIVGIGATFRVTRTYGGATDPVAFIFLPLPYSSPVLANNIELNWDAVNVNITTGANYTAYTATTVVLEYTKIA